MTSLKIMAFLHPALDVTATDSASDAKKRLIVEGESYRRRQRPVISRLDEKSPGLTKTISHPKMIG